jgi:hypothetical protein
MCLHCPTIQIRRPGYARLSLFYILFGIKDQDIKLEILE